jgi:hypothetical protein
MVSGKDVEAERQVHAALVNTRGVSKRIAKETLESGSDLIDSVSFQRLGVLFPIDTL